MKTFKNIEAVEKKCLKAKGAEKINIWDDTIKVNKTQYKMTEYGGGSVMRLPYDYVIFENKKQDKTITIKYDCPSFNKGVCTQTFRFISVEEY